MKFLWSFLFSGPNSSLYAAQDEVSHRNRILDHQDSVSKSEIQVKKPSLHKGEGLTGKYKNCGKPEIILC